MELFHEGQGAGTFFFSLLLVLVITLIAKRAGFFNLPISKSHLTPTLKQTCGAFAVYLFFAFIFFPLALVVIAYAITGSLTHFSTLSKELLGWLQLSALFIVFLFLLLYCLLIDRKTFRGILWGEKPPSWRLFFKSIGMGMLTWGVSYPFVIFLGAIGTFISLWIWGKSGVDQVAVKQLKMTMGHPLLFALTIFTIITIVPFLEELLFRGFLQSWLKRYVGRIWAIVIAAVIFSLVHFSASQGEGNLELILSLSSLSFFLGFIYERERTLWAPIALHMTFNAFSIFLIVFST